VTVQTVSKMEAVLRSITDIEFVQILVEKWNTASKFWRITNLVLGSYAGLYAAQYAFIKSKRKYYGYPPGPIDLPFKLLLCPSSLLNRWNTEWLYTVPPRYGDVTDIGGGRGTLINDPVLARKLFDDPRAMDTMFGGLSFSEMMFIFESGKPWSDRRRIIQSNLMSTMKGEFVEKATTQFISSKVFPLIDRDIAAGKVIDLETLLRPIGFNVVLSACFGKEIESLDGPLYVEWDKISRHFVSQKARQIVAMGLASCFTWNFPDLDSRLSLALQRLVAGKPDFIQGLRDMVDFVEKLDAAQDVEVERDDDVKLFSDFIDEYLKMENGKYTKRHLMGDMMLMFFAAGDTTYSANAFALLTAAKRPKLQQELHEEVIQAFGDHVEGIKLKGRLSKIPKLRAFIHEIMRVYPPVPVTGTRRIWGEGVTVGGYNLPDGCLPSINASAIHHNPKYWIKDYDAEKHGNVNMNDIHLDFWMEDGQFVRRKQSANFFPFHSGKRDCPGQALAMKQLMIVLSIMFMKYTLESVDESDEERIAYVVNFGTIAPKESRIRVRRR